MISEEEAFKFLSRELEQRVGVYLSPSKDTLVEGRLRMRLFELGFEGFSEYVDYLENQQDDSEEWKLVISKLTTHTTSFFREQTHFNQLAKFIESSSEKNQRSAPFRIWSAAASTGEEAYSIAMLLEQTFPKLNFEIYASDVDFWSLQQAKEGVFLSSKLKEVPAQFREHYFQTGREELIDWMRFRPENKPKIQFFQHSLIDPAPFEAGYFDVVFCRNVFIYFKRPTTDEVIRQIARVTRPNGLLFISHSETLHSPGPHWKSLKNSLYLRLQE